MWKRLLKQFGNNWAECRIISQGLSITKLHRENMITYREGNNLSIDLFYFMIDM